MIAADFVVNERTKQTLTLPALCPSRPCLCLCPRRPPGRHQQVLAVWGVASSTSTGKLALGDEAHHEGTQYLRWSRNNNAIASKTSLLRTLGSKETSSPSSHADSARLPIHCGELHA